MMIPAFPKIHRLTQKGIHYIDGVPVADSIFGRDPFEPVKYSKIEDILHSQIDVIVENIPETDDCGGKNFFSSILESSKNSNECCLDVNKDEKTIFVFDVSSEEGLKEIAGRLKQEEAYRLCSGCAGFAAYYPNMLAFPKKEEHVYSGRSRFSKTKSVPSLLCLCGSVNPITVKQMDYAENHGFVRENLPCHKKLNPEYYQSESGQKELDNLYERLQSSEKYIMEQMMYILK